MTREQELVALIDEAEALLRIARSGCDRTVRDQGSDVRLPSEARMFALHFSPENRDGPAPLEVRGNGAVYSWFRKVNQTLRKHMVAKDDMLAMLEQRARMADNISAALRLIRQGFAAHAEAMLNETLDMMKENGK